MDVLSKKLLKPTFVNGAWRKPLSVRKQKILGLAEAKPIDPTPKRWELKEDKGHRYIKKQNDRLQKILKSHNNLPNSIEEKRKKERLERYDRKGINWFMPDYESKVERFFEKKSLSKRGIGFNMKEVPLATMNEFAMESLRRDPLGIEELPQQRKSKRYTEMLEILKNGGRPLDTGKKSKKKKKK